MAQLYWSDFFARAISQLCWLSSTYYHSFLLPLLLACVALAEPARDGKTLLREGGRLAVVGGAGSVVYFLKDPFFATVFSAGVANHVLLLACVAAYAALFCRLKNSTRVVVVSVVFAEINWVFAITRLVLFRSIPLETANLIQIALLLAAVLLIRRFRPDEAETMPTAYWLTMLSIGVVSVGCLFSLLILESVEMNHGAVSRSLAVMLPCFFVVSLLVYFLYYVLSSEHRKAELLAAQQIRQARDVEFYGRTQALCEELRSVRHELKNHIAAMDTLLSAQRYEELKTYFEGFLDSNRTALEEFHCENRLVGSVVSGFVSAARAEGIRLDFSAAVPEKLRVADGDLCSLLSNLLENAVEGCRKAGGDRIRASLHTEKGYLFLSVANPAAGDVLADNPGLRTTKPSPSGHGCGIPLVRRIAARYGGCASFGMENGWFAADVMLCMEESAE